MTKKRGISRGYKNLQRALFRAEINKAVANLKNEEELSSEVSKLSKLIALLNANRTYAYGQHFVLKVNGTVAPEEENRLVLRSCRRTMNTN